MEIYRSNNTEHRMLGQNGLNSVHVMKTGEGVINAHDGKWSPR